MKNNYKWIILAVLLLGLQLSDVAAAPRDFGAFSNVKTSSARIPFYRDQRLVFYVRSQNLSMMGKLLEAQWPIIDIIRKGINVENVAKSDNSNNIYTLGAELNEVTEYWRNRSYSEGVILTEAAMLDQSNRIASGSDKVFLRSPMLDLNGVGFTADLSKQIVKITSDVEIVLRNSGKQSLTTPFSTVAKESDAGEEKVSVIRAFCNELELDIANNTITLIGNVRIFDAAGTITSNRLEIEFEGSSEQESKDSSEQFIANSSRQLRTARFIGNVRAVRNLTAEEAGKGEQYAEADLAVYNIAGDTLEMTGSRPRLVRGNDYARAEKIVIMPGKQIIRFYQDCIFAANRDGSGSGKEASQDVITADYADWDYPGNLIRLIGNAQLKSVAEATEMSADKLNITLSDEEKSSSALVIKGANGANSKRPKQVVADGRVQLTRDNNGVEESASAGRITYSSDGEKIILEDSPVLRHGEDVISGERMTYLIGEERLQVFNSSRVVLSGASIGSGDIARLNASAPAAGEDNTPVTVDSNNADINYGGNLITFDGKVRVRGRGMKLDSDKLDIFLTNVQSDEAENAKSGADKAMAEKQPLRAQASGNVCAEDSTGVLRTNLLNVYFGDKAQPGKVDVEIISADGKMHLENKPGAVDKSSSTLLGNSGNGITSLDAERGIINLLNNEADFYGKVVVKDTSVMLECEHLKAQAKRSDNLVPSIQSYQARDEFPDRLAIGEERELVRIIADDNVRMTRMLPDGDTQKVRGDRAVYEVAERTVELSCVPPRRPQAVTGNSGMIGDKVIIDLDTEELFVENGDVLTRTDEIGF